MKIEILAHGISTASAHPTWSWIVAIVIAATIIMFGGKSSI